eukprot:scpid98072/ scgid28849/ 
MSDLRSCVMRSVCPVVYALKLCCRLQTESIARVIPCAFSQLLQCLISHGGLEPSSSRHLMALLVSFSNAMVAIVCRTAHCLHRLTHFSTLPSCIWPIAAIT